MGERFFRYGELPLVLLALLRKRELHGYELMTELAGLLAPLYTPSPGSIYPALQALLAEGLVAKDEEAEPKRYRLTRTGTAALDKRLGKLAGFEERTGVRVLSAGSLDAELTRLAGLAHRAYRKDGAAVMALLTDARERIARVLDGKGTR
jgi:DNA-binding PadR family transcriptional regulator